MNISSRFSFPWQHKQVYSILNQLQFPLNLLTRITRKKMMADDELDFDLSPIHKQSNDKKHRKNTLFQTVERSNDDDDIGNSDDLLQSPTASPERQVDRFTASKPRRRTGGWGDDIPKSGKRRGSVFELDDERLKPVQYDSDNDMPLIPDLDEVQDEDLTQQVAQAPQIMMNRVATYKELDNDLLKHSAFATFEDIDLRILMKNLSTEAELNEPDEPWIWDVLFTQVTSEINAEKEMEDRNNDKENSA